jgi:hypothetical protein
VDAGVRPDDRTTVFRPAKVGVTARGGPAAAAAFLEKAVLLTADPVRRADRLLAAAQANLHAGTYEQALGLVTAAESGPLEEMQSVRADLLRGHVAHDQGTALAGPDRLDQPVQPVAFADPVHQPRCAAPPAGHTASWLIQITGLISSGRADAAPAYFSPEARAWPGCGQGMRSARRVRPRRDREAAHRPSDQSGGPHVCLNR